MMPTNLMHKEGETQYVTPLYSGSSEAVMSDEESKLSIVPGVAGCEGCSATNSRVKSFILMNCFVHHHQIIDDIIEEPIW